MNAGNANHDRAVSDLRIVAGFVDISLEDVVEHLSKLGAGDVILRTERAGRIAVDITLFDHADNAVLGPRADLSCVGKLFKRLFVRAGDAKNSGEYQKDLLTGYVGARIKRGIACSGKRTHLIGLGNRKIEPIV